MDGRRTELPSSGGLCYALLKNCWEQIVRKGPYIYYVINTGGRVGQPNYYILSTDYMDHKQNNCFTWAFAKNNSIEIPGEQA